MLDTVAGASRAADCQQRQPVCQRDGQKASDNRGGMPDTFGFFISSSVFVVTRFFYGGCFCYLFGCRDDTLRVCPLFEQAIAFKEENDMTMLSAACSAAYGLDSSCGGLVDGNKDKPECNDGKTPDWPDRAVRQESGFLPRTSLYTENNKARAIRFSTLDAICRALTASRGTCSEFVEDEADGS